jgi:hypothetical protein
MPRERGDHSVAVIREAGARGESGRFESISMPGDFLLLNLRSEVSDAQTAAISSALRHLCRSRTAITNGRQGPNFADLS